MLTLHPQSAMEHLHHRFVAADGLGQRRRDRLRGDRGRADDPGPHPRPGPARRAARRRPGPLADPAGRQRPGGRRGGRPPPPAAPGSRPAARSSGSSPGSRTSCRAASRPIAGSRPLASRRETQRRGRARDPRPRRRRRRPRARGLRLRRHRAPQAGDQLGQRRPGRARHGPGGPRQGLRPGHRPGRRRPATRPCELLTEAYTAARHGRGRPSVSARVVDPLRAKVVAGLDRAVRRRRRSPRRRCSRSSRRRARRRSTCGAMVRGPDGAPYVIDRATKTVYRVDLKRKTRHGRRPGGREGRRHDRGRRRSSSPSVAGTC